MKLKVSSLMKYDTIYGKERVDRPHGRAILNACVIHRIFGLTKGLNVDCIDLKSKNYKSSAICNFPRSLFVRTTIVVTDLVIVTK